MAFATDDEALAAAIAASLEFEAAKPASAGHVQGLIPILAGSFAGDTQAAAKGEAKADDSLASGSGTATVHTATSTDYYVRG